MPRGCHKCHQPAVPMSWHCHRTAVECMAMPWHRHSSANWASHAVGNSRASSSRAVGQMLDSGQQDSPSNRLGPVKLSNRSSQAAQTVRPIGQTKLSGLASLASQAVGQAEQSGQSSQSSSESQSFAVGADCGKSCVNLPFSYGGTVGLASSAESSAHLPRIFRESSAMLVKPKAHSSIPRISSFL